MRAIDGRPLARTHSAVLSTLAASAAASAVPPAHSKPNSARVHGVDRQAASAPAAPSVIQMKGRATRRPRASGCCVAFTSATIGLPAVKAAKARKRASGVVRPCCGASP